MLVIIGSKDPYLASHIARIVREGGLHCIRTGKSERVLKELKQPNKIAIIDVNWTAAQEPGALKRMVNIGRISGNKLICICPNQEEELKKLAKASRPAKTFIRYDLELDFKEYLKEIAVSPVRGR